MNYQVFKLANGLQVICAPMQETKAVAIEISVGTGSRFEKPDKQGLAHFLEHMFFKGTFKRPTTLDIARELDSVGAFYNAYTSEEQTGFWIKASFEHFRLGLDILFDILFHSKFDKAEVEKEKRVILEEINMYQDTPQSYVLDVAKELFYGQQPLGWSVAGTKQTVPKLTQDDLIAFRDGLYAPENMIISVAGKGKPQDWLAKISQCFSKIKTKSDKKLIKVTEKQTQPSVKIHYKKTDQAHLVLGFRGIKRTDERRPTLRVLNNILGETMSSFLFTEVREKRGLAYYISSDYWDFIETGAIGAAAGVDLNKIQDVIPVILEQFNRFKTAKIPKNEIDRAKENLKGRLYLSLEDCSSTATFLADSLMFWKKIKSPEEVIKETMAVSADDIQKLARQIFLPQRLNLAIVGPFKNKEEFAKILKI
ncbi:MAG: hypothetical protein COS97_00900 [Candidatus Nealsonbacteria bacterium CG07_land_8_20_14_0_80_40_10]|nr:MAG: hypothetical protein COS97_00900 [Candidatus Nealsonbacteria bacterium CG07_land_8_20_14_0_80_40_10]